MNTSITLKLDSMIRDHNTFGLLSVDFRIILYINFKPGQPIKDVQAEVGLSHRGFYLKLQGLIEAGLISVVNDPIDKRCRCLFVTEHTKAMLDSVYSTYFRLATPESVVDDLPASP